ncbi:MAG: FAD-dependent oxidoreductase [Pedobacter sp.]|nr:MAG: FAD-dependent oxidoreductase [Pedobacter sp.]
MIKEAFTSKRSLKNRKITASLIVVGGGLAGVCCAITAARAGIKVVLANDRPVVGGNSSSEVRLWVLGATSHMGNNNRWAREGGVIDEILVENTFRNPESNPILFDTVLLEKVVAEENITLLLNTAVYEVIKGEGDKIAFVKGFCSQNSTTYELHAPLFCDASGDGILGFMSGAAFRIGAEAQEEYGEKFAPNKEYGELLGHSIYFYSKDVGKPVRFVPPAYALSDITKIPRYKNFNTKDIGCKLWWIEYGGTRDTVHDTEEIKWELWKVVYGVWNYIKNSGNFPDSENLTLEWVGTIPGKRESRRFEGDYMLVQQDVVEQRQHDDAVAFGGWSLDLHPAEGVFSEKPGCNQWHSKGIFQIPYRTLYSKNITNLFLTGRIISASHVAFASTRVMGTCAYVGQAVGQAAALCIANKTNPKSLSTGKYLRELQNELLKNGQYIPGMRLVDSEDLVQSATIKASSELALNEIAERKGDAMFSDLNFSAAQILPVEGAIPVMSIKVKSKEKTKLEVQLRVSKKPDNYTPEEVLEILTFDLGEGITELSLKFQAEVLPKRYIFICFMKNDLLQIETSEQRITGVLSAFNSYNEAVSNKGKQQPEGDIGVDSFEFWCPQRRPAGHNFALKFDKPIYTFKAQFINNGIARPVEEPNAWVADFKDQTPYIQLTWNTVQKIKKVVLCFDTDFDHPMESSLMGHPESAMPFCISNYELLNEKGDVLHRTTGNYQTINTINFSQPIDVQQLTIKVKHPSIHTPAAIFEVRCYA